jgi:hypothetical protein
MLQSRFVAPIKNCGNFHTASSLVYIRHYKMSLWQSSKVLNYFFFFSSIHIVVNFLETFVISRLNWNYSETLKGFNVEECSMPQPVRLNVETNPIFFLCFLYVGKVIISRYSMYGIRFVFHVCSTSNLLPRILTSWRCTCIACIAAHQQQLSTRPYTLLR